MKPNLAPSTGDKSQKSASLEHPEELEDNSTGQTVSYQGGPYYLYNLGRSLLSFVISGICELFYFLSLVSFVYFLSHKDPLHKWNMYSNFSPLEVTIINFSILAPLKPR